MCARQAGRVLPGDRVLGRVRRLGAAVPAALRPQPLARSRRSSPRPAAAPLDEHLLFSSGWEWGYWLQRRRRRCARATSCPATPTRRSIADAARAGPRRAATDARSTQLVDAQHERADRSSALAAYIAGRDIAIDAGRQLGIVSQPDRDDVRRSRRGAPIARRRSRRACSSRSPRTPTSSTRIAAELDALDAADDRGGPRAPRRRRDRSRCARGSWSRLYGATLAHLAGDDVGADDRSRTRGRRCSPRRDGRRRSPRTPISTTRTGAPARRQARRTRPSTSTAISTWPTRCATGTASSTQVGAILGNTTTRRPGCLF